MPDPPSIYDYITPEFTNAKSSYDYWHDLCSKFGPHALRGSTLNLQPFQELLPQCVEQDLISQSDADYLLRGIVEGFDFDLDESKIPNGYRPNYRSAFDNKGTITDALRKRVASGKTLKLGVWNSKDPLPTGSRGCVVPQGGVPQKLEPDSIRPVSDHTKTGFNAAVDMTNMQHTLDTYNEIGRELQYAYYMRVEDVDGAFPIIPLAPRLWKYMYVHWFDVDRPLAEQTRPNTLYLHAFGDFGTAPMPAIWDKFFRGVKAMARVAGVLTLPMPHFVDDSSLIGPDAKLVDAEAIRLGDFLLTLGVSFKDIKSRPAAMRQLVLGFWWDSVARTRTLETHKLKLYLDHLRSAHDSHYLTLHDMQVLSGRMQRAALTMPPRATVYLANILKLMKGLRMPWHRRRLNAAVRKDLQMLITVLEENSGRGYFSYDQFGRAHDVYTDAAKERRHTGGGYFSLCGAYDMWIYGGSASRRPIDYLEGDAVLRAARDLGPTWRKKVVPVWIDNSSFCYSLQKGRSKAERLNVLLRQLFILSVRYECVFEPHWLPSADNVAADALSRGDWERFQAYADEHLPRGIRLARRGL